MLTELEPPLVISTKGKKWESKGEVQEILMGQNPKFRRQKIDGSPMVEVTLYDPLKVGCPSFTMHW